MSSEKMANIWMTVDIIHGIKTYLYLQQRLLLLADVVFFLQQIVGPQEGLQGCGLPRGTLTLRGQLGFFGGGGKRERKRMKTPFEMTAYSSPPSKTLSG